MVDETPDCSNREQVVLAFRRVDENLAGHKEFFGLYITDSITAAALVAITEDTILHINIKLEHCRGQCYDGASLMSLVQRRVLPQSLLARSHRLSSPTVKPRSQ